jgi:hypothetical protein
MNTHRAGYVEIEGVVETTMKIFVKSHSLDIFATTTYTLVVKTIRVKTIVGKHNLNLA